MMSPLVLLLSISKFAGVVGILTVAANAFAFRYFQKKNLAPFENPIDESQDILAVFPIDRDVDDGGFFFALATAPAHVEDKLNDAWLQFAKETPFKVGDIASGKVQQVIRQSEGIQITEGTVQQSGNGDQGVSSINEEIPRKRDVGVESLKDENGIQTKPVELLKEDRGMHWERSEMPLLEESEVIDQGMETEKSFNEKASGSDNGGVQVRKEINQNIDMNEFVTLDSKQESLDLAYHVGSHVGDPLSLYSEEKKKICGGIPIDQSQLKGNNGPKEETVLQYGTPKTSRKLVKVAMEAMIRGFEKFIKEDEKRNVAAWHNTPYPEQRLRFWSDPDTELRLAQGTNVTVFRMGVDWSRVMPVEPVDGISKSVDWAALDHYRAIIEKVHAYGMRVMLTLFHHSLPPWAGAYGGWKLTKTIEYFLEFTRLSVEKFADLVDFWIIFNEPHVFAMLTYCAGAWPGGHPDLLETATAALPQGVFKLVMHTMAVAHLKAYDLIHDISKRTTKKTRVGVSHHVSFMRPYGLFDALAVVLSDSITRFDYIDDICDKLDFIGINYYGQEVVSVPGLKLVSNDEYSESGRGVSPDGLYRVLLDFHNRYKKFRLPYIITENGVSDATDYIRRPYLLEHLLAVNAAMKKGVSIQGYCFWTTCDNWEWADGYGPKFGLVAVNRENNLARIPRPSYYLYSEIAKTGTVTKKQREKAWNELQTAADQGKKRPFCRAVNSHGLMLAGGLDVQVERCFVQRDWRFGHYKPDGLQDPLSQLLRSIWSIPLVRSKNDARNLIKSHSKYTDVPVSSSGDLKNETFDKLKAHELRENVAVTG